MRHFLKSEAPALPVEALPVGMIAAPVPGLLVLLSGAKQALPPGCDRAGPRAVAMPPVARRTQEKLDVTPGTGPDTQLDHDAPTTHAAVDLPAGPCKMEVMGWLDPSLVDPPGSLECQLRAAVFWGVVDYPSMMLATPEQETGLPATPRSRRSLSRAFRRSLPVSRTEADSGRGGSHLPTLRRHEQSVG